MIKKGNFQKKLWSFNHMEKMKEPIDLMFELNLNRIMFFEMQQRKSIPPDLNKAALDLQLTRFLDDTILDAKEILKLKGLKKIEELKKYSVQHEFVNDYEVVNKWDDYIIQPNDLGYSLFFAYRLKQVNLGVGDTTFGIANFLTFQLKKYQSDKNEFFAFLRDCCDFFNRSILNDGIKNIVERWISIQQIEDNSESKTKEKKNIEVEHSNIKVFSNKAIIYGILLIGKTINDSDINKIFLKYCKNQDFGRFSRDFKDIADLHLIKYLTRIKETKSASTRHRGTLIETKRFLLRFKRSKPTNEISEAIRIINKFIDDFQNEYGKAYG
jgi:hypothetical protein